MMFSPSKLTIDGLANARKQRNLRCLGTPSSRRIDLVPVPQGRLRMFLQSADVKQWDLWHNSGIFHGYSTNPVTLEKDKVRCTIKSLTSLAKRAFELGAQELQVECWGDSATKLTSVAFDLAGIDTQRMVVKVPCTLEGVQAATILRDANIRVTLTGIYNSAQVLLAQAVGAEYAATYLGRLQDVHGEFQGRSQVVQMQKIIRGQGSQMRLAVASLRDLSDVSHLAAMGCDTFNIPPKVATKMFMVDMTLDAAGEFEAAAKRNGGYDSE